MHSLGIHYRPAGGPAKLRHWIPRTAEYRLLEAGDLFELSLRIGGVTTRAYSGILTRVGQAVGPFGRTVGPVGEFVVA